MLATLRCGACVVALSLISASTQGQRPPSEKDEIAGARVLERGAFVRAVLRANPSVEAARQSWRAAVAREQQAGAFDDPTIEVAVAPLSIGSTRAPLGYEIGISQMLPWFGRRGFERDAMKAEAAAAASDLEVARRELATTAIMLHGRYVVAVRSLEINAQHAKLVEALRAAVSAQLEAGQGSAQEVLQAEAEIADLETDALALGAERDVVIAQMNELLHRAPDAALPPPASTPSAPLPTRDPTSLEREAVGSRAEIAAARLRADAESAKADAASRAYFPSVMLSTSYSSMWEMAEHRWMIGASINVPLPSEQRAGAVDEARAMHAQYASEVERMTAAARTEVYVALRRLQESTQLLELFEKRLLPVARGRVEAAQASFAVSQTALAMVIDAERNLRNVELKRELAQADREQRRAELERALGRIPGLADAEVGR